MITLRPIEELIPASYNPRKVDPERLALIALSIRKLGWLLPVYATDTGELLSGHQRTHIAREVGYTHAPTETMPAMDSNVRKAVNILFNRSTNDMAVDSVPEEMKAELKRIDPYALSRDLPDRREHYPCMEAKMEPLGPLLKENGGAWIDYARNVSASLYGHGVLMPIICGPDSKVVNGIGRLQMLAEKKKTHGLVVRLNESESHFAKVMLNLLSMDFNVETHYQDLLRYNSFRRARRARSSLGMGFVFGLGVSFTKDFDHTDRKRITEWKRKFGSSVVDFGAGHLHETAILRSMGVRVTPFEPYRLGDAGQIDKAESIHICRAFLADVAAGVPYSSVFISSVLNSVPFAADRRAIVKIAAALCGPSTVLYAWASARTNSMIRQVTQKPLNERATGYATFPLNYEPGVMLGDFQEAPKVQKYHTKVEFYDLFKECFERVNISGNGDSVGAQCVMPKPPVGLREALEFEFDLPYPDGSRMGLASEAIAAFSTRLKVQL